jgi:hypothetical protein
MFELSDILFRIPVAREPHPTSPILTAELLLDAKTISGFKRVSVETAETFLIKFLLFIGLYLTNYRVSFTTYQESKHYEVLIL